MEAKHSARGALSRAGERARGVPVALWILVAIAVLARAVLVVAYRPAFLIFNDTADYVAGAGDFGLFNDPAHPAGYSMFLKLAHALSADLDFTIVIQHLLGIGAGLLLYAAVRRLGAPVWAGLVAAAAVLLPIDQLALEHSFLSEPLFTFLLASFLYAAVRALEAEHPSTVLGWVAGAAVMLGLAGWVRTAAVPLVPLFGVWALVALGHGWRERVAGAALAVAPAVALLFAYAAWSDAKTGDFTINRMSGWTQYGRVAQFADCSKFDPPSGTEELCELTPPAERPGPRFYIWTQESPARRLYGYPPAGNEELGDFARAAIGAEPLEYARTVAGSFARFFFPQDPPERDYDGAGYDEISLDRRLPATEEQLRVDFFNPYYDDEGPVSVNRPARWLADLQDYIRVHPFLLFASAVLAAAGLGTAAGRTRLAILLFGGTAIVVLAVSASNTYNARYALPIDGPLAAAGALGLWASMQALQRRSRSAREPRTERVD
jgi:hypothetical protein